LKRKRFSRKAYLVCAFLISVFVAGWLLPDNAAIPVAGASRHDWNQDTFWYEPWGASKVHKGIDIFAKRGTAVLSATTGLVVYNGTLSRGGDVVLVLGPKWRVHYYAHLRTRNVILGQWVSRSQVIGAVGDSGNARGKPPHLHYSIVTLVPYPWRWDGGTHGWLKMFFLNPGNLLSGSKTINPNP
jgi:murein DD-endopeptidase MepM/ murein hydrolase activator NlpD